MSLPSSGPQPLALPPWPKSQSINGSQHLQPVTGRSPELSGPFNNHGPRLPTGTDTMSFACSAPVDVPYMKVLELRDASAIEVLNFHHRKV